MSARTSAAARPRPTAAAPTNGLVIIGAGVGRTATSSLQEALEILGYGPCYHMREVYKDPNGLAKWNQVGDLLQAKGHARDYDQWDDIFFGYQSTVDFPAAMVYRELLAQHPDAKVILTVRDPEKWVKSVLETIAPASPFWVFLFWLTRLRNHQAQRMVRNVVWEPFCGSVANGRDRQALLKAFDRHNAQVKASVPPAQLLVVDVTLPAEQGGGWTRLCEFLGQPVPENVPFPHSWDTAEFQKMIAARRQKAVKRLLVGGGTAAAVMMTMVAAAVGVGRRRHR